MPNPSCTKPGKAAPLLAVAALALLGFPERLAAAPNPAAAGDAAASDAATSDVAASAARVAKAQDVQTDLARLATGGRRFLRQ